MGGNIFDETGKVYLGGMIRFVGYCPGDQERGIIFVGYLCYRGTFHLNTQKIGKIGQQIIGGL